MFLVREGTHAKLHLVRDIGGEPDAKALCGYFPKGEWAVVGQFPPPGCTVCPLCHRANEGVTRALGVLGPAHAQGSS